VLRVEGVSKAFGPKVVLREVRLRLQAGDHVAILGRSGVGKSVLLRIVAGLIPPDSGSIALWGRSFDGLPEKDWLPVRRRLGMVFQSGALFDSMTIGENVAFPLREHGGFSEDEIDGRVRERLEWVELSDSYDLMPSELSGGMRRRVALARTLATEPELLLYDEPTTGLDPITSRNMSRLMQKLEGKLGSASILVTHDIECARMVAGTWAYLSDGRFLAYGSPEEVEASDVPELRAFFAPSTGEGSW